MGFLLEALTQSEDNEVREFDMSSTPKRVFNLKEKEEQDEQGN